MLSKQINCRCPTGLASEVLKSVRMYAKKPDAGNCRRAIVDIPKVTVPCENNKPTKTSLLHRIKLKVIEGGTNFGTPFRMLKPTQVADTKPEESKVKANAKTSKALVAAEGDDDDYEKGKEVKKDMGMTDLVKATPTLPVQSQHGLQVSILGADTNLGQYMALLLKQCGYIKKLRLFDARAEMCDKTNTARDLFHVVRDLQHIDTSCRLQLYRHYCGELERCLQNTDIVVMLESCYVDLEMPFDQRFIKQAPIVKAYADAIATECPRAFIIVCASPIECMVPLLTETLKETGWYDPRKILGSMAVPEMKASTIAARALSLEPRYTQVPCIGGTEGDSLVPLFSKAVEYFDFTSNNATDLTEAVRKATLAKSEKLSEAHALSGLVTKVAQALLGEDRPRVTGFVETDISQVISPSRYIATVVDLGTEGISQWIGFPKMSDREDKLLNRLEENEPELATTPEEECVICVNAKATMQTSPCGHRVVCRRCFVKTIQMAVSQRLLPLRCVICRAKILRLRQAPRLVTSKSWQVSSGSGKSWSVPGSVSSYSVGARSVPASASLYSVTSRESSLSGVSSVSSNSGGNLNNACSTKICGGSKCSGVCLGAIPRSVATAPARPRQPASNTLRRSQHHSMKARLQDYQVMSYTGGATSSGEPSGRLPPIREFQREFREGRKESNAPSSTSTRIRCAQKIVTQLETSPQKEQQHFFRPLKPSNSDDPTRSRDHSNETELKQENPKGKTKKEDKKKKEDKSAKQEDKKKDEAVDNKKNEAAERKKEEKLRLKAEKEAKKEAKLLAKEEERQAKLLAKEEERQAKLLAKEEKKKAKKEAKLAAQAEKEKNK